MASNQINIIQYSNGKSSEFLFGGTHKINHINDKYVKITQYPKSPKTNCQFNYKSHQGNNQYDALGRMYIVHSHPHSIMCFRPSNR